MPSAARSRTSWSHSGYRCSSSCQVHQSRLPKSVTRWPDQSCSQTAESSVPASCISPTTRRTLSVPPCRPSTAPSSSQSGRGGGVLAVARRWTSARGSAAADTSARRLGCQEARTTVDGSRVSATANAWVPAASGSSSTPRTSPVTNVGHAAFVIASVPPAPLAVTFARTVMGCVPRPTPCSRTTIGTVRPERSNGANCSPMPCTPAPGLRPLTSATASTSRTDTPRAASPSPAPGSTVSRNSRDWSQPCTRPAISSRPASSVADRTTWSASTHRCVTEGQK